MRKLFLSALILSSVAAAAPASAEHRGYDRGYRHGADIERQIDRIEDQIDRLRDRRLISRGEARQLERRAERIDRLHDRFRRGGLDRYERRELQHRLAELRRDIRAERLEGRYAQRRYRGR